MRIVFFLLLSVTTAFAHEKELKTKADLLATAKFTSERQHPWPFALLSIGNNMQSFQYYGGAPYWHDGLDIRSLPQQPIFAAAGGKVVNIQNYNPGNELYWEIAILDDEGFVWKYHHVDSTTIPAEIQKAFKGRSKVASGALLGNVVKWPVTSFGEVYHHLHLLVVAKDGQYINPFLLMEPLADTSAPIITKIGIAKDHQPIDGNQVSGAHALFLEASDLVLHKKFILPPHRISYKLDGADEKLVWEFINLPSAKNDADFIQDFYMTGTCGNYGCRKFIFNLNFTQKEPRKTMRLDPGTHQVEVFVEDMVGNKASESFQWKVL
jgi:hypothetical protein